MKITDRIHILKHDFEIVLGPGRTVPRFVNSLVIFTERILLVDAGLRDSYRHIFDYIIKQGRSITEIVTLLLSHAHPDHIGSAHTIREKTGCRVLAHKEEQQWIEDIDLQAKERPVPGFYGLVDKAVRIDGYLEDGQILETDDQMKIRVIHAPGHSKGSVNLFLQDDRVLFTADSVPLKNDIPNYNNYADMLKSLKAIQANKDYSILLSSWAPPLYDRIKINEMLGEGLSYMELLDDSVRRNYTGQEKSLLEFCRKTIEELGLPAFYVNPITDRAFRTHLTD